MAKDTDGSTAPSKLDITINGCTDAPPVVTTPVAGTGNDLVLQEGTTSSTQGHDLVGSWRGVDHLGLHHEQDSPAAR